MKGVARRHSLVTLQRREEEEKKIYFHGVGDLTDSVANETNLSSLQRRSNNPAMNSCLTESVFRDMWNQITQYKYYIVRM